MPLIDTHCHLDALDVAGQGAAVWARALAAGVGHCVIPAVERANFEAVRVLAHKTGNSYCLGIHPLYVPQATLEDLQFLHDELERCRDDARLVAVGEIGLDFFVPALTSPEMREKQEYFLRTQLAFARQFDLPVVLHTRRSVDRVLKYLRAATSATNSAKTVAVTAWSGIAHAFNGSMQQAQAFTGLGIKLGFGGAVTFERALQLRRLVQTLPLDALVLETDAPDIAPHWLYTTAQQRSLGVIPIQNEPAELVRIAQHIADLRGIELVQLGSACTTNALQALPKLAQLCV